MPCTRFNWPFCQLLSACKPYRIISYRTNAAAAANNDWWCNDKLLRVKFYVCQKREPVSDNTVVFHIQLLLSDQQNLGQLLCAQGYAEPDLPLPSPVSVMSDVGDASDAVAAANVSFGLLTPVSPLPSESLVRLSSKRLVRHYATFALIALRSVEYWGWSLSKTSCGNYSLFYTASQRWLEIAAQFYRWSSVVCLSVCLSVCLLVTFLSPQKWSNQSRCSLWTDSGGPEEPLLDHGPDPQAEGAVLGVVWSIWRHCELFCSVHKDG